ncbi:hypothetical protein CKAH01_18996 [Colletotrichum kahawae]|uniref:Uncharacterized protein n=1 Tax=Colletotrichum kahawae TaxID=34407 RepID=A0AAD9Y503_COLKA|nr:hypothetical protein CKAH01_18996 [Colletotrichum kahawae]
MVSPVVKVLSHLAILSSMLGHVSAEQRAKLFVGRENDPLQPRAFLSSCNVWGTLGTEKNKMAARCRSKTDSWTWSVLDLNHCIVYKDRSLMAQDE